MLDEEFHQTQKNPTNWNEFLRTDENKKELFAYIAEELTKTIHEKVIISTVGLDVITLMNS